MTYGAPTLTHYGKPSRVNSPENLRRRRQSRARWAFYGRLGSLRLAESVLRAIHSDFVNRDSHCIDPILNDEIWRAVFAIGKIRQLLIDGHKNDWRRVP